MNNRKDKKILHKEVNQCEEDDITKVRWLNHKKGYKYDNNKSLT